MTKSELRQAEGVAAAAQAEWFSALATAHRDAAMAAEVIEEDKTATAWRVRATEMDAKAEQERQRAKRLGYFGDITDTWRSLLPPTGPQPPGTPES